MNLKHFNHDKDNIFSALGISKKRKEAILNELTEKANFQNMIFGNFTNSKAIELLQEITKTDAEFVAAVFAIGVREGMQQCEAAYQPLLN
jgi:hypothetical protein